MDNSENKVKRIIRFELVVPFLAIMLVVAIAMDIVWLPTALGFDFCDFIMYGKFHFSKSMLFMFFRFSFWNSMLVPILHQFFGLELRSFDNAF